MKGIYFASFYFRVWDLTREIRENKNPAKISTYTVHAFVAGKSRSRSSQYDPSQNNYPAE